MIWIDLFVDPNQGADIANAVAEERSRCLAIVADVGAKLSHGDAINACRDIFGAIREGK